MWAAAWFRPSPIDRASLGMGNERMVDMAPSGGTARAKNNPGVWYGCLLGHADENRQGFQNHTYIPHIPKIAGLTIGAAIHQTRMVSLAEDGLFLADKGRNRASVDGGALGPLTALAREALGQSPKKFADSSKPSLPPCGEPAVAYWDTRIPISRTPSRNR